MGIREGGIVGFGAGGALSARRSLWQTLLVDAVCGGVLGLLSGDDAGNPGSPRRGSADPGLKSAAPLGLVWSRGRSGERQRGPSKNAQSFQHLGIDDATPQPSAIHAGDHIRQTWACIVNGWGFPSGCAAGRLEPIKIFYSLRLAHRVVCRDVGVVFSK